MIKEISSRLFYGFYNSMYSNDDEFLDDENEIKDSLKECLGSDIEFDVEYEYSDESWKEYKKNVCECFRDTYMEYLVDELPCEITDDDDFLLDVISKDDNIVVVSPKYYNYRSDECYWKIETNYRTLQLIKDYTLNMEGAKEYLRNNFTSKDGFVSFIKNDIEYWEQLDIKNYDERYIYCLFDMFLYLSNKDIKFEINYDTLDKICKYEYASPIIYYDGNEYSLMDFVEKMRIKEIFSL